MVAIDMLKTAFQTTEIVKQMLVKEMIVKLDQSYLQQSKLSR